jgi:hypothetical protein
VSSLPRRSHKGCGRQEYGYRHQTDRYDPMRPLPLMLMFFPMCTSPVKDCSSSVKGGGYSESSPCAEPVDQASAPLEVQFDFSERFFRAVEKKGGETLHRAPMGSRRSNLAVAISVLDYTADDLVSLNPLHPPNGAVNVVGIELNCRHEALSQRFINIRFGGKASGVRKVPDFGNYRVFTDLARRWFNQWRV